MPTKQVARFFGRRQKSSDWKIIVNKENTIPSNKETLISLSPTIKQYLENNPSSPSFEIEITSLPVQNSAWSNLSNYFNDDFLFVNIIDRNFYLEISQKLGIEALTQFINTISLNFQNTHDFIISNYNKDNSFLLKLENLEQTIFQLNPITFQSVLKSIRDFINDENQQNSPDNTLKKRKKYLTKLLFNYCKTRIKEEELNQGINLINELQEYIKEDLLIIIKNLNELDMSEHHLVRLLYEKKILTKEDMTKIINLMKPDELKEGNYAHLHSNLIFLLDFFISELALNQTQFFNKRIYARIGNPIKPFPTISCIMNKNDDKNCFSVDACDTKLGDYNLSDLMKNDWELHKKLCIKGVNESEICTLIRNDDLDNFISFISKVDNFDINGKVPFSIYERHQDIQNCNYIQYAAFYSSIKIFKYLIIQKAHLSNVIYNFAFAGGNFEIIHICEEKVKIENVEPIGLRIRPFILGSNEITAMPYDFAIKYHQHEIVQWIYENQRVLDKSLKLIKDNQPLFNLENHSNLTQKCLKNCNFISLHYVLTLDYYFPYIICQAIEADLYELTKFSLNFKFLKENDCVLNGNALYNSVLTNDVEYVKLFSQNKEMLDHQKENFYAMSIQKACIQNNIEIAEFLLKSFPEIEINKYASYSKNPLYIVCENGYTEMLQLLLKYRLNDIDFNFILEHARIFFFLLNKTSLQIACKKGHLNIVKLLVSTEKVDLNFDCETHKKPLYYALVSGNIELVKYLSSIVSPNEEKDSNQVNFYFIPACKSGNLELIQLFLNKYKDIIDINTNECPKDVILNKKIFFLIKIITKSLKK